MRDWDSFIFLPLWFWLFVLPTLIAAYCAIQPAKAKPIISSFWPALDRLYRASGFVAAIFMVIILLLIVGQMISRWSGLVFPGGTEFAGYAMACTSFFGLSYALTHGAHIRVSILLNANAFTRMWVDAVAMLLSAIIATYFARYAIKTNFMSEMLNDRTQGLDQVPEWVLAVFTMLGTWPWNWGSIWSDSSSEMVFTPVWLPQISMSIGTILLAIAIWDHLFRLLIARETQIKSESVE